MAKNKTNEDKSNKREETERQIIALKDEAIRGFLLYKPQFKELEAGYFATIPEDTLKSLRKRKKSAVSFKIIFAKVRKVAIEIMKAYFDSDEAINVQAFLKDDETSARLTAVLNKLLAKEIKRLKFYTRIRSCVEDVLVYGTTVAKVYWDAASESLKFHPLSIRDVFFDPHSDSFDDITYLVHRMFLSPMFLKKAYPEIDNWDSYVNQSTVGLTQRFQSSNIKDYERIEIIEVYRKLENGKWAVSTLLGNKFLRMDVELEDGHPFIIGITAPQFIGVDEAYAVRAYGNSFIAPMLPLQTEMIVRRNQMIDAINIILGQRFLANKTAGLRDDQIEGTSKKIDVTDINQVRELPYPNINPAMMDITRQDMEIQEISGIFKTVQGGPISGITNTATGVQASVSMSNDVIDDIVRALNESFFEPLFTRMAKLLYKYSPDPSFYKIERGASPEISVNINAGVGANTAAVVSQNLDSAILMTTNTINTFARVNDFERVKKYSRLLDLFYKEKAKSLKLRNISKILEELNDSDNGAIDGNEYTVNGGIRGNGANATNGVFEDFVGAMQNAQGQFDMGGGAEDTYR